MPDESYIRIPLGGRYRDKPSTAWTIIDFADAHLMAYKWCLNRQRGDKLAYAIRWVPRGDGTYRSERMSRVILGLERGDPRRADHINGDRLDNRRENLRIVTPQQNAQNMASHRDALSPYRGVSWFAPKGKWMARAYVNGKSHHLGYFDDDAEAGAVARAFREAHMTHNVESRH